MLQILLCRLRRYALNLALIVGRVETCSLILHHNTRRNKTVCFVLTNWARFSFDVLRNPDSFLKFVITFGANKIIKRHIKLRIGIISSVFHIILSGRASWEESSNLPTEQICGLQKFGAQKKNKEEKSESCHTGKILQYAWQNILHAYGSCSANVR